MLCFFCGHFKSLPNDPYSCGCHRALCEDAEMRSTTETKTNAAPVVKGSAPPAPFGQSGACQDDDFPLDDGPLTASEDAEYLDWTCTPKTEIQNDGSSRCFISTVQPMQGNRKHALHLIREFEIQPAVAMKREMEQAAHASSKVRAIRVREDDLRKWGDNLEMLSQKALPPVKQPAKPAGTVDKKPEQVSSYRKKRPTPLESFQETGQNDWSKTREFVPGKSFNVVTNRKHSSSLPGLGFPQHGEVSGLCKPQRSVNKRLGSRAASTLAATLSLPALFSAGKSRPRAWRCPSNPSSELP